MPWTDYVRGGGTFVAVENTGRHALLQPDAWPVSRLTGLKVLGTCEGQRVTFSAGPGRWQRLAGLALSAAGKEPLEIVSARPLGQAETDRIVARLSALYGATFEVNVKVDPSLLGGVRITMGDRSIDGSIAGRLDQVARELVPTAPTAIGRSHSYLS